MQTPTPEQRLALRKRPAGGAAMYQRWQELLFAHWALEPALIQATLPAGLQVDTFEGRAYLGVVPFYMNRIRPRGLPCVPGISDFLELNVRTYVFDASGQSGVWFYSLDCNQPLAVWLARTFYKLPYQHAAMSARNTTGGIDYQCRRKESPSAARFDYALDDRAPTLAVPGSLDFFLIERYLLYSHRAGRLYRGQVFHAPYPLCPARLDCCELQHMAPAGLPEFETAPIHVIGSRGVAVEIFGLQALG